MRTRLVLAWSISLTFISVTLTLAAPLQLTVQPKGTNQVALTIGPAIQGDVHGVLARTNGSKATLYLHDHRSPSCPNSQQIHLQRGFIKTFQAALAFAGAAAWDKPRSRYSVQFHPRRKHHQELIDKGLVKTNFFPD